MFDELEEKDATPMKKAMRKLADQGSCLGMENLSKEQKSKLDSMMGEVKSMLSEAGVEDPKEVVEQYFGDSGEEGMEMESEGAQEDEKDDYGGKKAVIVAMLKKKALGSETK